MKKHLVALLLLLAAAVPAAAEDVSIPFNKLNLVADARWDGGQDKVVLILHGTLSHNRMKTVAALQNLLAGKGFSTIAPNLSLGLDRRAGSFDCAADHRHRHEDALDELGAWLDWLKGRGVKEVTLLGFSRGASQVSRFVTERNHPLVKRLVLVSPITWTWESATGRFPPRDKLGLLETLKRAKRAVEMNRGETMFKDLRFLHCEKAHVSAASVVSYYDPDETRRDTPTLLPRLKLPFLVVAGSQDALLPDMLPRLKAMPEVTGKLKVIEGADHFLNDIFAEEAVDAIADFLKK